MTTSDDGKPDGISGRKPRAFTLDQQAAPKPQAAADPVRPSRKPMAISAPVVITPPEEDPFLGSAAAAELDPVALRPKRRWTAGGVLMASLGILASLAIGVWTEALISSLFAELPWLGWFATGVTAIALMALVVLVVREVRGLSRLTSVAVLRADLASAGRAVSATEAHKLIARVLALLDGKPETARGRKAIDALEGEIVDGPNLIEFAERELLAGLDRQARTLTLNAARRVSVVTAVSPRAIVDVAYVVFEATRLIRAMAKLYGGRPGTLGMLRLSRDVIAHLAVTGTVAAGDSIIQQLVGHGVAAKLSARLGEGVINGLMTARIGISAMDLCRPMPFAALSRPGSSEFLTELARFNQRQGDSVREE
ncbi:putative membrane protein [Hoeflea marina]|uniref:Putative membrane protein n=1 Tax=Hoeflea marina TaxID=274592 RepID=A0A317PSI8_9HYPH|nr:TIGR01620 family protein [Hoeflea marina]PWW04423.1 putative membrane protein [Hoeflea marina]